MSNNPTKESSSSSSTTGPSSTSSSSASSSSKSGPSSDQPNLPSFPSTIIKSHLTEDLDDSGDPRFTTSKDINEIAFIIKDAAVLAVVSISLFFSFFFFFI